MKSLLRKINPLVVLSIALAIGLAFIVKAYIDQPDRVVCANKVDRAAIKADNEGQRYHANLVECN